MKSERRSIIKKLFASVAGIAGIGAASKVVAGPAGAEAAPIEASASRHESGGMEMSQDLFAGHTIFNNMVFIAGKGAHVPGDVTSHTKIVLDAIEEELKKAGSSMDKVLKVNVYLDKIEDWATMNAVYKGRFGKKPPVRTTVAVKGIPGNSLIEIDCIAYI
ncbi:RidA family protein [Dyadobacter arcticus]|uniref:Enamine deaminase RidA (YjgF/YER057c/UK114 family) n=1 Tax=Dyadobacter arcticus TaxID=1078754 RepID=A0ABX0UJ88_9BACT|nr:RidA family protein [Dyadobacter arcticus]NIJ53072.1 enamine deaminase RidA (YjgF/YER057c/UK114 family) [Dyadobacter arcticus]